MDMPIIDRVFGMERGNVLDFSNRTFADFFRDEFGATSTILVGWPRARAEPSALATTCAKRTAGLPLLAALTAGGSAT